MTVCCDCKQPIVERCDACKIRRQLTRTMESVNKLRERFKAGHFSGVVVVGTSK